MHNKQAAANAEKKKPEEIIGGSDVTPIGSAALPDKEEEEVDPDEDDDDDLDDLDDDDDDDDE